MLEAIISSATVLQSREGCWWFGEPGQCDQLRRLAGAVAVCAIADVLFSVAFSIVAETKSQNPRAYRYATSNVYSGFTYRWSVKCARTYTDQFTYTGMIGVP